MPFPHVFEPVALTLPFILENATVTSNTIATEQQAIYKPVRGERPDDVQLPVRHPHRLVGGGGGERAGGAEVGAGEVFLAPELLDQLVTPALFWKYGKPVADKVIGEREEQRQQRVRAKRFELVFEKDPKFGRRRHHNARYKCPE